MEFNIHWQDNTTDDHDQYTMGCFKGEYTLEETRKKIKGYYKSLADNTGDKDLVVYIHRVKQQVIIDFEKKIMNYRINHNSNRALFQICKLIMKFSF